MPDEVQVDATHSTSPALSLSPVFHARCKLIAPGLRLKAGDEAEVVVLEHHPHPRARPGVQKRHGTPVHHAPHRRIISGDEAVAGSVKKQNDFLPLLPQALILSRSRVHERGLQSMMQAGAGAEALCGWSHARIHIAAQAMDYP